MLTDAARVPLGRRAWIGDGRLGASVAADGTVDWFCSAGVSGRPDLWRLLDPSGPAVRVGPVRDGAGAGRRLPPSRQSYRGGSNVVETVMEGPGGRRVSVVDFMPWPGPGLERPGAIVRLVRALAGPVDVEVEVVTGGNRRGEAAPSEAGMILDGLEVRAPAPFRYQPLGAETDRWRALVHLDSGEEVAVVIHRREGRLTAEPSAAHRLLESTEAAWRSWAAALVYTGPYRPAFERALLSVRMLTGDLGAPLASGTGSLPRRVGSERSFDDRWVRLRDVAGAVGILARSGFLEDAEAAEEWLRGAVTTADIPWPAWLDADAQPVPGAEELPFAGWRRSGPVVHGRDPVPAGAGLAGEVVAAFDASRHGPFGPTGRSGPLSAAWPALAAATDRAADEWRRPDTGRWEIRRPLRTYVAGRVDTWYGLDRMSRLARAANPLDLQAAAWQQEARDVLAWLESSGVAADGGLRMDGGAAPGTDEADAALLVVAWRGPWPVAHPVVAATVDRVLERLSAGPLLYRYSDRIADEVAGPDNPDLEASLMAVSALARLGRWEEAHLRMEAVATLVGSATGIPGETADPVSGELFGNLPCTAAALALVDAALALDAGPR